MPHRWPPFGDSGSNFTSVSTVTAIAQAVSLREVEITMALATVDGSERRSHHIIAGREQLSTREVLINHLPKEGNHVYVTKTFCWLLEM